MSWANKITVHLSSLTVYLLSSIVYSITDSYIIIIIIAIISTLRICSRSYIQDHYLQDLYPPPRQPTFLVVNLFHSAQLLCVSGSDMRITVPVGLLVPDGGKGHC